MQYAKLIASSLITIDVTASSCQLICDVTVKCEGLLESHVTYWYLMLLTKQKTQFVASDISLQPFIDNRQQ